MISHLIQAFGHAFQGIDHFFRSCRNGRIHLRIAAVVIGLGLILGLSRQDWCTVLLCIALVICLEMANEAIERLADFIQPEQDERIRRIKDVSAGMVLLASIFAAVIGTLVFLAYL
ncbi:MAG: diacylglycerol kinase family protein [Chitinophagales bacterium]|nr:diacylglycerol kinase family protein [Chitinophagales bacterium]HAE12869.1 diacylglycerol kinase [Bacteroidota bacterium]HPR28118.1 diacylglycerol kinase family protein [Chitinophagales bacterium]HQU39821.1 diacylglycerol kinase family protein [Chitinophagales bacterium]